MPVRASRRTAVLAISTLLGGCNAVVLHPSGDVAAQQRDLIIASTFLMLLIIVPVMVLTGWFAWRYRQSNTQARYEPDWHHSTMLELVIWSAPLLIIIALGALTWIGTHTLDPFRRVNRIAAGHPLDPAGKALRVQVVALDWKWLFIYPDQGIASVNELALPLDVPIDLDITSATVMNSLFIPALAGQVYAMPAMQTQLHAVLNQPGVYEGISANYSGAGFSGMHFQVLGMPSEQFAAWIKSVKTAGGSLGRPDYLALAHPSQNVPVRHFAQVAADLFPAIVNLCVEPGKMCLHDMMAIDAGGGLGLGSVYNTGRLSYDRELAVDYGADATDAREHILALCSTVTGLQSSPVVSLNIVAPTVAPALR